MKTIKPFIEAGFYTVPLQGKLDRLPDGKKTTPKFEPNWKAKYQKEFNRKETAIGGVITGAVSNIIAIDCDDQDIYDLFRSLDPSNKFVFVSRGKPAGGGTIIYKYVTGLESFSIQGGHTHLDFYANGGFVYLPTDSSSIKEEWPGDDVPPLTQAPNTVVSLIRTLHEQSSLARPTAVAQTSIKYTNYLAPQIGLLLLKEQCIPSLFKVITPRDFRGEDQYVRLGYLDPNEVPEGRGSEYMSKVSAILGKDSSISHDMYVQAMQIINRLWDKPIDNDKLNKTIIDPMIEGRATIDNEPIWQYDEHWKSRGMAFTTKLGDAVEVFYDDKRAAYYVLNYTTSTLKTFTREGDMFGYIEPIAQMLPPRKDVKAMVPVVRTVVQPSMPFGFFGADIYTRQFNIFMQTPALAIINDPGSYSGLYKKPKTIIKFMESFIPDASTREYVLGFLKMKFTTFKYSPVVLYFLGAHGSGKDTFVNILAAILGDQYLARPTAKEFLEHYNGWLLDKYFVQLDEYGNQLHSLQDKEIALGKVKAYTGKQSVQIRQMRTDGFPYEHMATFIMTANSNPLLIEDGDRRVHLISTPNVLKNEEWVTGITEVIEAIGEEINDFAYYLATEVRSITPDQYQTPPESDAKRVMIAEMLPAAQRLCYYFTHHMFNEIENLMEEHMAYEVLRRSADCRVEEDALVELYMGMTDHAGTERGLSKVMKANNFEKIPSTRNGVKTYFFRVPGLDRYRYTIEEL